MLRARVTGTAAVVLAACGHSDSYPTVVAALGPSSDGPVVQLTYNVEQDYWPAWTEDGRGILYSFADPGSRVGHRCLGVLPANGGTRLWELCDNRAVRRDSINSYSAYALRSDGALLVAEAVSGLGGLSDFAGRTTLWLADTATPMVRTTLLTLPLRVDTVLVSWMSDLAWTGPTSFIALGQQFYLAPRCPAPCSGEDTLFADHGGVVMTGTIANNQATLHAIAGTQGATGYSLAQAGSVVVFTMAHDLALYRVPVGGGMPEPAPDPAALDTLYNQVGELVGVSCQGNSCLVARDGILITGSYWQEVPFFGWQYSTAFATRLSPLMAGLYRLSLIDGSDTAIAIGTSIFADPQISPVTGDVVVHVGGAWGHLQTFRDSADGSGNLMLYRGLMR